MRTLKGSGLANLAFAAALIMAAVSVHAGCGEKTINEERELVSIRVTPQTPEMTAGGKLCFAASGVDQDGGALIVSPAWEAHEGRIDSNGVYIAPNKKTIDRVSAFVGRVSGTAVISIKPQSDAASLDIYPKISKISVGAAEKFRVIGRNQFGEEVPVEAVEWSCRYGKIDANGNYIAPIHPTNEAISAKTISATGVLPIDVEARETYKIFISPKAGQVKASYGMVFSTAAFDIYGNRLDRFPDLRYSAKLGRIDADGNYLAPPATGTDEVVVNCGFITDSASVEIVP